MRTDDLINTLVGDHASQPRPKPVAHGLVMAIIGGLAISAALFSIKFGPRPDILSAFCSLRFDMKGAENLVLAIPAPWVAPTLLRASTTSLPAQPPSIL